MTRDPRYDVLFEPVKIGPKVMRNRFYQTPHCTGLGVDHPGAQAGLRAMKAEGGWAVVNTEACSIHPASDDGPWIDARLWDDNDVRNLALMCERVHEHDALAGVELHFGGVHHSGYESRLPARGASQIPSETFWMGCCREMDRDEIRDLRAFYVDAARRACEAGFDLILVYGAESSPITQQFLMPYFNKRTDEYGGSFENRARLFREVIESVRETAGDECAIGVRFSIDTLRDDDLGISVEEDGIAFIAHVDHLVDLWDVQIGGRVVAEWMDAAGPSRFRAENFQRPWVEKIRPYTSKPIVGVGRFTSPDTMVEVIRSGQLDIIGAARPSIADPFLPKKIEEGRFDEIRECIGCNVCGSRYNQGGSRIVCTQNATTGEEYRRGWHPEKFTRAENAANDVLIVGAGSAGMECAVILGKRGMRRVHLVDMAGEIGGIMRWIPNLPGLGEWGRVVSYRQAQLAKLRNVDFIPNVKLDAQQVREYGAEIVIFATGGYWATDGVTAATHEPIHGADADLPHCLTPEQIMVEGKAIPGERVLVYDGDGYFMAVGLAEKLAREGRRVTYVTPFQQAAPYLSYTGEGVYVNRLLRSLNVDVVDTHVVTHISDVGVRGHHVYDDHPVEWLAESTVLVTQRRSRHELYRGLLNGPRAPLDHGIRQIHRIGDCLAPRMLAECIYDGHRLGREIDSPNPSIPRPYIRENRHIGADDEDYDGFLETVHADW